MPFNRSHLQEKKKLILIAWHPYKFVLGLNLGINKDILTEDAAKEHRLLICIFFSMADYLVINISSQNTVGSVSYTHLTLPTTPYV